VKVKIMIEFMEIEEKSDDVRFVTFAGPTDVTRQGK